MLINSTGLKVCSEWKQARIVHGITTMCLMKIFAHKTPYKPSQLYLYVCVCVCVCTFVSALGPIVVFAVQKQAQKRNWCFLVRLGSDTYLGRKLKGTLGRQSYYHGWSQTSWLQFNPRLNGLPFNLIVFGNRLAYVAFDKQFSISQSKSAFVPFPTFAVLR